LLATNDRSRDSGLAEEPRQRNLRIRHTLLPRDFGYAIDGLKVRILVIKLVRVVIGLGAAGLAVILATTVPRDKTARQWAPGARWQCFGTAEGNH